ncbi:MAG: hypothetical protein M0Q49_01640 [Porticoccaceae bacterium]|nr:hypothetical protein [Porticoccaceae bacterium]
MLNTLLDRLRTKCPSFATIAPAPSSATITTVDAALASSSLMSLLSAVVPGVFAVEIPEGRTPPDAAYRLVSAQPVEVAGTRVVTAVSFVVTLRAPRYEVLIPLLSDLEAGIAGSTDAISITDAALDYDPAKGHYLAGLEVQYAVAAVPGAAGWPMLLVDADALTGLPSRYDNTVRQRVNRGYSFTLVCATDAIASLRAELEAALLGWQQAPAAEPFEFTHGLPLSLPGGLYAWRDIYSDAGYIKQP